MGEVDSMAFVRTGLLIVLLVLGWTAVRAHPLGPPAAPVASPLVTPQPAP